MPANQEVKSMVDSALSNWLHQMSKKSYRHGMFCQMMIYNMPYQNTTVIIMSFLLKKKQHNQVIFW